MFEKTKALEVFQISEETYDELLKEFVVQADLKIRAVESALENGDTETAAKEIHSFKGVPAICAWMIATTPWLPLNPPCGRKIALKR